MEHSDVASLAERTEAPSSHRLPTVSASQALQGLRSASANFLSTSVEALDRLLQDPSRLRQPHERVHQSGGLPRGQITEVYGPPGVGKTTFGLQACVNALLQGDQVLWLDARDKVAAPRLKQIILLGLRRRALDGSPSATDQIRMEHILQRFKHYMVPTLPHMLTLMARSNDLIRPQGISLIIVDSLSTLLDNAYPRNPSDRLSSERNESRSRRKALLSDLVGNLVRLAATRNVALLVVNQTVTVSGGENGLSLASALQETVWETAVAARIVLYRDWPPQGRERAAALDAKARRVRYAAVLKACGATLSNNGSGNTASFTIEEHGIQDRDLDDGEQSLAAPLPSPLKGRKRSFGEVAGSVADEVPSDEDYDWGEGDDVATEAP